MSSVLYINDMIYGQQFLVDVYNNWHITEALQDETCELELFILFNYLQRYGILCP